ncbi:MAG: hypothetical protein KKF48_04715 [Nanoarchaeota archaeon]|nr:hypothetical protein [Nanoarchaeota archaeon]MBU1028319.1 hypothetical protein [Nanoarchaeota archaeon]
MGNKSLDKNYILKLKDLSGESAKIASNMYCYGKKEYITSQYISKIWREELKLEKLQGGNRSLTTKQVSGLYNFCKGDFKLMLKISGTEKSRLIKACLNNNLKPNNMPILKSRKKNNNSKVGKIYKTNPYGRKITGRKVFGDDY